MKEELKVKAEIEYWAERLKEAKPNTRLEYLIRRGIQVKEEELIHLLRRKVAEVTSSKDGQKHDGQLK